jgi:protein gp37
MSTKTIDANTQAPNGIALYERACAALAEAIAVDEVLVIRDQAAQLAACAHIAKNHKVEADAIVLRTRAIRRLGQLMRAQKATVGLATGGEHGGRAKIDGVRKTPSIIRPTLSMQGIDKNLAKQARALSTLSNEEFEQKVVELHEAVTSTVAKVAKSIALPEEEKHESARAAEIEITLKQWELMTAAERHECLDPKNFPSGAKLTKQDSDGIDWAQHSWNPVVGCKHSCRTYCWAHDITLRFPNLYPHGFDPVFRPRMLDAPRNTPVPGEAASDTRFKNVFTCSMADLFGRWVPREWIEAVLNVVRENSQWNFLFLSKFPKRMAEFDFPANCWLGTTIDLQVRIANAEAAFAKLRELNKDAVLWLSCEPMLEPLRFERLDLFNWVVIGGAARSMRTPEFRPPFRWIMDLVAKADAVGCKIFQKTNLLGNRILELPFDAPIKTDATAAPDVFHYLGKHEVAQS